MGKPRRQVTALGRCRGPGPAGETPRRGGSPPSRRPETWSGRRRPGRRWRAAAWAGEPCGRGAPRRWGQGRGRPAPRRWTGERSPRREMGPRFPRSGRAPRPALPAGPGGGGGRPAERGTRPGAASPPGAPKPAGERKRCGRREARSPASPGDCEPGSAFVSPRRLSPAGELPVVKVSCPRLCASRHSRHPLCAS